MRWSRVVKTYSSRDSIITTTTNVFVNLERCISLLTDGSPV